MLLFLEWTGIVLKKLIDYILSILETVVASTPRFFDALFGVHDSLLKYLLDLNTKIIKYTLNFVTTTTENLIENILDSRKKTSAIPLTIQLSFLYIFLGLLIGVSFKTFTVIPIISFDFLMNFVISLYIFIIVLTLLLITGKSKVEMKYIADFCNKSIFPIITVIFLIVGLPLSDANEFAIVNIDKSINFSGIYIQVTPLLFTVLINLKQLWLNIEESNS